MRGDIVPPKRPEVVQLRRQPDQLIEATQDTPSVLPQPEAAFKPLQATNSPQNGDETGAPPDARQINEPLEPPTPKKRLPLKSKLLAIAGSFIVVIALVIVGIWLWYGQQLKAVEPNSDEMVKITIESGTDPSGIASLLKKNGIIKSDAAFSWYVRFEGKSGLLQSGAYRLGKGEDVPTIVKHLTSGNTDTFSVTFLPGATLQKHRQVLIDAGYAASVVDAALDKSYDHPLFAGKPATSDLEGYIYGETYSFGADATPVQILVHTFDEYQSVIEENNLMGQYKAQGFNLYQAITMASIIQREVATPGDAAQVAQVFKLRFDGGMQLGSDVTYQYIADKTGQKRRVDLDSPYNTRRYTGLPPGPISSPGLAALKAVGSPAAGDFVYFLSGDDDKTYFARTNEEHEKNIREHCQKKCQII